MMQLLLVLKLGWVETEVGMRDMEKGVVNNGRKSWRPKGPA